MILERGGGSVSGMLKPAVVLALVALPSVQAFLSAAPAQHAAPAAPTVRMAPVIRETDGTLFDNVVTVLGERYVDERFRTETLPALAAQFRPRAREAASLGEQRAIVHDMLSRIPASHLALLSAPTFAALTADLVGRAYPNFGFQLIQSPGGYYAGFVLEDGPAARAGLLHGDRIRTIDGVAPHQSPRFDWRSDDAYLGDERDPAIHAVTAAAGDRIVVEVERRPGEMLTVAIAAEEYGPMDAARASARVFRRGAQCAGYVHFWYVHVSGVPALVKDAADGPLRDCAALVLDLRGRGGSFMEVAKIVAVVREYRASGREVVALVDRQSRSGKDILAFEFKEAALARLVGEPTAGAAIPATFADVGHQTYLMFPTGRIPRFTDALELKPLEPHVRAPRPAMHAAGEDPILAAGLDEAFRLIDKKEQSR